MGRGCGAGNEKAQDGKAGENRERLEKQRGGEFFATGDFLGPVGVDMGMIRGFLFLLVGVFAAAGLLTVLRSPDWLNWKLALVAGEFGHWLALVALALGGAAWALRAGHAGLAWSTAVLSVGAAVLLLKPTWEAARIGRTLPQRLEAAFGGAASPRAAFSVGGWFESAPAPVAVETREFAPGLKLDLYRATGRELRARRRRAS